MNARKLNQQPRTQLDSDSRAEIELSETNGESVVEPTVEALVRYSQENGRVCPVPARWDDLWQMLPERRRVGGGWEPALPLILAAWSSTPALLKILRLREHVQWAADHGALRMVDGFLRSLPESDWAHLSSF